MDGDVTVPSVRTIKLSKRQVDGVNKFVWTFEDGTDYSPLFNLVVGANSWLFTPVIVEPWQPPPPEVPPTETPA